MYIWTGIELIMWVIGFMFLYLSRELDYSESIEGVLMFLCGVIFMLVCAVSAAIKLVWY